MPATIGIVPHYEGFLNDVLFDPAVDKDNHLGHWRTFRDRAKEEGLAVHTLDRANNPRLIVSWGQEIDPGEAIWIFYLDEPPVVRPDLYKRFDELCAKASRVFTHSPTLAKYRSNVRQFSIPQPVRLFDASWMENENRKLLAMLSANKRPASFRGELYTKRLRVASELARRELIDVYGPGWERTLRTYYFYPPWTRRVRSRWKGIAPSKFEVLSQYDFCLAFENCSSPGYITEKVFDPMFVGCIPVYLGAPEIDQVLPEDTFIDYRKYPSPAALADFLRDMSRQEKSARRLAMKTYLESNDFLNRFSVEAWAEQLIQEVLTLLK